MRVDPRDPLRRAHARRTRDRALREATRGVRFPSRPALQNPRVPPRTRGRAAPRRRAGGRFTEAGPGAEDCHGALGSGCPAAGRSGLRAQRPTPSATAWKSLTSATRFTLSSRVSSEASMTQGRFVVEHRWLATGPATASPTASTSRDVRESRGLPPRRPETRGSRAARGFLVAARRRWRAGGAFRRCPPRRACVRLLAHWSPAVALLEVAQCRAEFAIDYGSRRIGLAVSTTRAGWRFRSRRSSGPLDAA